MLDREFADIMFLDEAYQIKKDKRDLSEIIAENMGISLEKAEILCREYKDTVNNMMRTLLQRD